MGSQAAGLLEACAVSPAPLPLGRVRPFDYPPGGHLTIALDVRSPDSGHAARAFVEDCCADCAVPEDKRSDAVRCTSEIFGNTVHARFPRGRRLVFVRFRFGVSTLAVRVHDPDPTLPVASVPDLLSVLDDPDPDAGLGGWGLSQVVPALADWWDAAVVPCGRGKWVEFGMSWAPAWSPS